MELWIRSQKKEYLVQCNCLHISTECNQYSIWNNNVLLGVYKSKERALEVLDEIQNRIIKLSALEITELNEKNASIYVKIFNEEKINNIKAVYEMPKE